MNPALPQEDGLVTANTAGITDADGLVGVTFRFRWQSRRGAGAFSHRRSEHADLRADRRRCGSEPAGGGALHRQPRHGPDVTSAATGVVGDVFAGTAGRRPLHRHGRPGQCVRPRRC